MRSQPVVLITIALVALVSSLVTAHFVPADAGAVGGATDDRILPRAPLDPSAAAIARDAEADRIRAHLLAAEQYLDSRRVFWMTPEQLKNRAGAIAALREYRARGQFAHNTVHPWRRVPLFVDSEGNRCALAYLMVNSGWRDLVNELAAEHNSSYVKDLADHAGFRQWLLETGLTLEEAARIQPTHAPTYAVR